MIEGFGMDVAALTSSVFFTSFFSVFSTGLISSFGFRDSETLGLSEESTVVTRSEVTGGLGDDGLSGFTLSTWGPN